MSNDAGLKLVPPQSTSADDGRIHLPFGLSYTTEELTRDLVAGLTVAAISLPQAMAYALLAGVDPRYGLYSAIVVTAVASIFGSSSHLVNGPTSAISLVVFTSLAFFDPEQKVEAAEAMFMLGVMVGSIQILIAVFKLGDLTRYISESVILGFMTAASILLALSQLGNALGVHDKGTGSQHVLLRLWLTLTAGDHYNLKALGITVVTIVLAVSFRKLVKRYRLPQFDMLLALVLVALGAYYFGWTTPGHSGKTIIAVAGNVPASLPTPHIPVVKLKWAGELASNSLAIAFLGLLEALSIAKAIANETGQKFDFNKQCLAEGLANLTGGFFRCLPGSGSLSRSAINYQAGALTRFSGIISASAVALAVLALAPLARFVPKPALAALLLLTAARLIDPKRIAYTIRATWLDATVLALTAITGLAFGLDEAILAGVGLSILLFVPRAAKLKANELVVDDEGVVREKLPDDPTCHAFILEDLEGELFFGAAIELERYLTALTHRAQADKINHIVLRVKRVRDPDVVSLEQFEHFLKHAEALGITVLLAGARPDLIEAFRRLRFQEWLPDDRIFPQGGDEDSATLAAIRKVYERLGDANSCEHCGPRKAVSAGNRRLYYLV
ncbi:MAG: SulP family inorganic anion transporter [Candidatus Binatus sp.]|jgi:sulfate permease, SulP family